MNKECCEVLPSRIGNNLKAIMKIMRFAIGRGKFDLNSTDLLKTGILEKSNYTLFHSKDQFDSREKEKDINSMIPWCQLRNGDKDKSLLNVEVSCDLFDPVVTDVGICHAFNPSQTLELLESSYFTESFEEAYKTDLPINSSTWNGTGAGSDYALNFYLLDAEFRRFQNIEPTIFKLAISDKEDYFDMKSLSQTIKPGYHTIWKVQAMEIVASNDLHRLDMEKRNCRFGDEIEGLKLFKVYSQTSCEFECRVLKAAEMCRCYPWHVPSLPAKIRHSLCGIYGNFCFDKVMNERELKINCTCLPNCHQIEFTFNEQVNKLDLDICNDKYSIERKLIEIIMEKGHNSLAYRYFTIDKLLTSNSNESLNLDPWYGDEKRIQFCRTMMLNHFAKVSVMFDRKKYVKTLTNLRVTFADKLSTFGTFT